MIVTLGQQCNIGEKPTVILYTYINRHAGTPKNFVNTANKNIVVHFIGDVVFPEYFICTISAFSLYGL